MTEGVMGREEMDWEARVRALEEEMRSAFLDRDVARLERIWTDDFAVNTPLDTVAPRRGVLAALAAHRIGHVSFEIAIEHVSRHGDTAVVMGRDAVVDVPGGETIHRRYTNVWRLTDGEWKAIARHASIARPPAAGPA